MTAEERPSEVAKPKQDGRIRDRWPWVEPTVWTDRMLEALEKGVKGGKWFSLFDKVFSARNLESAWQSVRRNKGAAGVDGVSIERFERSKDANLEVLRDELKNGRFRPLPVQRRNIPKPGTKKTRPLGIPTVRDRIVQTALRNVLEPIFETKFVDESFGFRPRRGAKDALRRVQQLLNAGYTWVVDADIQGYFDTIDRDLLMKEIERDVADSPVLALLRRFLSQKVMEDCREWTPIQGTPQGAVISPLLANIYLHAVDVSVKAAGFEVTRYADDLVIQCRSEGEARAAMELLRQLMAARGLTLHPEKTKTVDATQHGGFDFLGYHFERGYRWPRGKSVTALRDRIRSLTPRTHGYSLDDTISRINRVLRGWYNYFKHAIRNSLDAIDRWIRMRLRSIMRKRHKGKGRGRGLDHLKWPNAYFRNLGLFFLAEARDDARKHT